MVGKKRGEMLFDPDRTHARPASAVRDGEGLVQVQMGNVGPELSGTGHTHHCVEVGAVEIDLTAVLVDDPADLFDRLLEDPVGRRDR